MHRSRRSSLGIVSPPKIETVLKHLKILTERGIGRWKYTVKNTTPATLVFQSIFSFLDENYDDISPRVKESMSSVDLIPVEGTLIRPDRMFFRLSSDLSPFLFEVPRAFGAHDRFLRNIGVREAATSDDYAHCLKELKGTFGSSPLNFNELLATTKLLSLVGSDLAGSLLSPSVPLYCPDSLGVLRDLKSLVYNDAPWLVGRLDGRKIKFLHPRVGWGDVGGLGVRKMSDCVAEVLEEGFELALADDGRNSEDRMTEVIASGEFADAMRDLGAVGEVKHQLQQMSIKFVKDLKTRFILTDGKDSKKGVDVTLKKIGTLSFFDKVTRCILVAWPLLPASVSSELMVANSICDVVEGVGREQVGLVSAMLRGGVEGIDSAWNALRVDRGGGGTEQGHRGISGKGLVGADKDLVELKPMKRFVVGEVVAVKDSQGEYVYAKVLAVGDEEENCLKQIRLDTGEERMSSDVWSFKSGRDAGSEHKEDASSVEVEAEDFDIGNGSSVLFENIPVNGRASGSAKTNHRSSLGKIERAAMISAAEDILAGAGLSLKADSASLMQKIVAMNDNISKQEANNKTLLRDMEGINEVLDRNVNELFVCPITREVMTDPVVCADGHSYEREAIETWLGSHNSSPKTNARLANRTLIPNHALRAQIENSVQSRQMIMVFLENQKKM